MLGRDARLLDGTGSGFLADGERCVNPEIVCLPPGLKRIFLKRKGKVAAVHLRGSVKPLEHAETVETGAPLLAKSFDQNMLGVVVRR